MAKKFVRGITDIKTINNQDLDTNNVNDLLSDGEHNYIHRKNGKRDEYHNLTDNIKSIYSDDDTLLSVTNENSKYNKATLHPKHDVQKEQVLDSERTTITINHAPNATAEKTKVDTNPQKVLEHGNLLAYSDSGLTVNHQDGETTTKIALADEFLKNNAGNLASSDNTITLEATQSTYGKNYNVKLSQTLVDTINSKTDIVTYTTQTLEGFGSYRIVNIPSDHFYLGVVSIAQDNITNTFIVDDNHQLYHYLNNLNFFGGNAIKSGDILITKGNNTFTLSSSNTTGIENTSYVNVTTFIAQVDTNVPTVVPADVKHAPNK